MATKPIKTTCSECHTNLVLNEDAGTVTATVPSNGKRGSLHVPAHEVSTDLFDDGDLLTWDCPVPTCEYADSFDRWA